MTQEVSHADYDAALQNFDKDSTERTESVERAHEKRGSLSKRRQVAGWVGLGTTLVLLAVIAVPNVLAAIPNERPYAVGPVGEDDAPGLNECVEAIWQVRREFDQHVYKTKGQLPKRLAVLEEAPQTCPVCEEPWRYVRQGNAYRIACPEPETHGRSAVFLDHRVGPPRVRLDAGSEDGELK